MLQPTWPKSVGELKKPEIAFDVAKVIPSLESCELFMTTSSATLTTALTTTTLTTTAKMPQFRWRGQLELVRDQNGFGCARTSRHLRSSGWFSIQSFTKKELTNNSHLLLYIARLGIFFHKSGLWRSPKFSSCLVQSYHLMSEKKKIIIWMLLGSNPGQLRDCTASYCLYLCALVSGTTLKI